VEKNNFDVLRKALRPVSKARMDEIVRSRVGPTSSEQLTLADAGLEDEVRQLLDGDSSKATLQDKGSEKD
jgi:hypothetical protein